jgi:hypothetical protein
LLVTGNKPERNKAKRRPNSNKAKSQTTGTIKKVPKVFIMIIEEYLNGIELPFTVQEIIDQLVNFHNELIFNHGVVDGTKRFNTTRLYVINYLEGSKPENPPYMAVSKKYSFPSKLFKMLGLFTNVIDNHCAKSDRVIRSLFYLNRLSCDNNKLDLTEIIKEFSLDPKLKSDFHTFIKVWKKRVSFDRSPDLITEPTEKLVSSGPNRRPKWETADVEAKALVNSPLASSFETLCCLTGNQNLWTFIQGVANLQPPRKGTRLRYLTAIADKGNKSRAVALSDYWTQILLRPLMSDVQKIIHEYFHDYCSSKSHEQGFQKLKKFIRLGIKSYDITSWTDGFPAELQKIVLEELYSKELAHSWYSLVVTCDWEAKDTDGPINYKRGQGMGTAGSFDIATLTDLLVLEFVYYKFYKINLRQHKPNQPLLFNKVGDDLWCYDPENYIYNFYTKDLGIDINLSKTKEVTDTNLVAEYVSRNLNYDVDVSRISTNICRAVGKNLLDLPELARHLEERDVHSLPVKRIITGKSKDFTLFVRTFYILANMYPDRPGMKLLLREI